MCPKDTWQFLIPQHDKQRVPMDFEFWPLMSAPARPRWRDHATRRLVQRARPTAAVRGVHRLIEIDMGDRCARLRMARRRCTPPGSMWLREIACGSFFTAALVPPYRRIDNSLRSVPTALYRYRVPARTHAPPAAKPSAAEPIIPLVHAPDVRGFLTKFIPTASRALVGAGSWSGKGAATVLQPPNAP